MCMITGFESIQSLFDDSFPVFFVEIEEIKMEVK